MTKPKGSTVKSEALSARATKLWAELPKDPKTGRLMKRAGGAPPAPSADPAVTPPPAGGPDAGSPFVPGRGLHRFRPRSS